MKTIIEIIQFLDQGWGHASIKRTNYAIKAIEERVQNKGVDYLTIVLLRSIITDQNNKQLHYRSDEWLCKLFQILLLEHDLTITCIKDKMIVIQQLFK